MKDFPTPMIAILSNLTVLAVEPASNPAYVDVTVLYDGKRTRTLWAFAQNKDKNGPAELPSAGEVIDAEVFVKAAQTKSGRCYLNVQLRDFAPAAG